MSQKRTPAFHLHDIKACVGLGNPGKQYECTRHNIGFLFVEELVNHCGGIWASAQNLQYCELTFSHHENSQRLLVVKPQTYMNSSGRVIPFLQKKGIQPSQTLVVHDELEKKFGHVSLRFSGSARGHNGLRSIIEVWGKDFWRLRFGIGRPPEGVDVASYVLASFTKEEQTALPDLFDDAYNILFKQQ